MFYSEELAGCGWWLSYASEHSIPTFQTTNHLRIVEAVLDFTSTWWCKRDKHILGTSMGVISTGIGGFGDLLVVQPPSRTKLAVQETHDVRPSVQCHEAIILQGWGRKGLDVGALIWWPRYWRPGPAFHRVDDHHPQLWFQTNVRT